MAVWYGKTERAAPCHTLLPHSFLTIVHLFKGEASAFRRPGTGNVDAEDRDLKGPRNIGFTSQWSNASVRLGHYNQFLLKVPQSGLYLMELSGGVLFLVVVVCFCFGKKKKN